VCFDSTPYESLSPNVSRSVGFREERGFSVEPVRAEPGVGRGSAFEASQAAVIYLRQLPPGGFRHGVHLAGREIETGFVALEQGAFLLDEFEQEGLLVGEPIGKRRRLLRAERAGDRIDRA
jgi:hypothetical protein